MRYAVYKLFLVEQNIWPWPMDGYAVFHCSELVNKTDEVIGGGQRIECFCAGCHDVNDIN